MPDDVIPRPAPQPWEPLFPPDTDILPELPYPQRPDVFYDPQPAPPPPFDDYTTAEDFEPSPEDERRMAEEDRFEPPPETQPGDNPMLPGIPGVDRGAETALPGPPVIFPPGPPGPLFLRPQARASRPAPRTREAKRPRRRASRGSSTDDLLGVRVARGPRARTRGTESAARAQGPRVGRFPLAFRMPRPPRPPPIRRVGPRTDGAPGGDVAIPGTTTFPPIPGTIPRYEGFPRDVLPGVRRSPWPLPFPGAPYPLPAPAPPRRPAPRPLPRPRPEPIVVPELEPIVLPKIEPRSPVEIPAVGPRTVEIGGFEPDPFADPGTSPWPSTKKTPQEIPQFQPLFRPFSPRVSGIRRREKPRIARPELLSRVADVIGIPDLIPDLTGPNEPLLQRLATGTQQRTREEECECEEPEKKTPRPSRIVAKVKAFTRRMSQNSLDNLE